MPKGTFYDVGKKQERVSPVGVDDEKYYPSISVSVDEFPPLAEMKLGSIGEAVIRFRIGKYGGIEVMAMKSMNDDGEDEKEKKKKEAAAMQMQDEFSSKMSGEEE